MSGSPSNPPLLPSSLFPVDQSAETKGDRSAQVSTFLGVLLALAAQPAPVPAADDVLPDLKDAALTGSDQDSILAEIATLVNLGPRRTGTPGGDRAAEHMKAALGAAGVPEIWEHNVTTYQWEQTAHRVTVGGETIDAFPSEHSFLGAPSGDWTGEFTAGPGGRTAEVVYVGNASAEQLAAQDLSGKIVAFNLRFELPVAAMGLAAEFLYDPSMGMLAETPALARANPYLSNYEPVLEAIQAAGAVGFVGVLSDYFDSNEYRNEVYPRVPVTIPGFWVATGEWTRMRDLLVSAPGHAATLELDGRRYAAQTRSVFGLLPGASTDAVMVQSHHDSLGPGAVGNATGAATLLAIARHYGAQDASERPRSLLFASFDSHFTGYHSHQAWMAEHLADPAPRFKIVANTTLQNIGLQGEIEDGVLAMKAAPEAGVFLRSGGPAVRDAVIHAIEHHDLQRSAVIDIATLGTDGNIPTDATVASAAGIPTISYVSGPIYLYDDADTIDKVDAERLVPMAAAYVGMIDRLSRLSAQQLRG